MKSATRSATSAFFSAPESDVFPPTGGFLKRTFDVTAALTALIFISPIFLMLMLLVKLSDRGPVFYGHRRIGHNGKTFRCLKFRTMVVDGDRVLKAYLQANP
ncbi:lipopolysaccharide/colanic/teichoic acid biosynthesis glycosyltransferase [Rhizobium leucaenae]|nr:lipopolysaccharide/colanic/teichoic acid biosynthesis glycosyltransferase [Rhizobium leucaenae]